jgi:hypothetical protein
MSVMFEPGTLEDNRQDYQPNFVVGAGRWVNTATDGDVPQGQPFTITYSFVHDGTPIDSSYTDEDTVSNLHFTMNSRFSRGDGCVSRQGGGSLRPLERDHQHHLRRGVG